MARARNDERKQRDNRRQPPSFAHSILTGNDPEKLAALMNWGRAPMTVRIFIRR